MNKLFIEDLALQGKRVLIRVDFNVPLDEAGRITDDTRIKAALPTIRYVVEGGGKAILISHLGRPGGKPDPALSLAPVAKRLSELLGREVGFVGDCVGKEVEEAVSRMKDGDVILLENLRFHPGEEQGDEEFARALAAPADLYVDDAFGTAHRAHASMVGVTKFIKENAAGYLLKKEIEYLGRAIKNPKRPFIAILGGAKVSGKIGVIERLLDKVDSILIGGAMSYTFLKVEGVPVGASKVEETVEDKQGRKIDVSELVAGILRKASEKGVPILLPVDHVEADRIAEDATVKVVGRDGLEDGWIGLDIGPETIKLYVEKIRGARTVFWNGPMGFSEIKPFSKGTFAIAEALAESDAVSIIGGGDSVAAVNSIGVADRITHVSTGGGASLEFMEGKSLPAIAALTDK